MYLPTCVCVCVGSSRGWCLHKKCDFKYFSSKKCLNWIPISIEYNHSWGWKNLPIYLKYYLFFIQKEILYLWKKIWDKSSQVVFCVVNCLYLPFFMHQNFLSSSSFVSETKSNQYLSVMHLFYIFITKINVQIMFETVTNPSFHTKKGLNTEIIALVNIFKDSSIKIQKKWSTYK